MFQKLMFFNMKKITSFIFLFLILSVVNYSLLIDNCQSQWVQQSVPVTTGQFFDMKFVNANTGFIAHSTDVLLKTTNAGYNWVVNKNGRMSSLTIVDSMYFYGIGYNNQYGKLYKTTNGGITWDSSLSSFGYSFWKSYFLNRDTGLISSSDSFSNQIWITMDGGQTKQLVASFGGASQGLFHFLKEKVNGEYYGWYFYTNNNSLFVTTNSGLNWVSKPPIPDNVKSVFFINKDSGWVSAYNSSSYVFHTTDGGNTWTNYTMPSTSSNYDILFVTPQKGWIGCDLSNKIYATTNGGEVWGTQYISGFGSTALSFVDSVTGWAQTSYNTIGHTTNGGGSITSINRQNELTTNYSLQQNYPNPFNSKTIIKYSISNNSKVTLKVYDISGKEISTLVNRNQQKGVYNIIFDASNYSSGVYFYKLELIDEKQNKVFIETKRMIYLK